MTDNIKTSEISIGVVGLGLMGSSIVAALLVSGHPVKAIAPLPEDYNLGPKRIEEQLIHCGQSGLLSKPVSAYLNKLTVTENYDELHDCRLVLECVIEILEIKKVVYKKIEDVIAEGAILASNTSAIPISMLQQYVSRPERFLGIHWAEPAYMTRFLEITCGQQTASHLADWVFDLSHQWNKEPTLLRKDIRGFITNRLMYAVYREALSLVENGETTIEDADKAFRYDAGAWMTFMGVFRRMDYLGIQDFAQILNNVLPKLSNSDNVPAIMQEMVQLKARGIHTAHGLYEYTEEEAKHWNEAFTAFNQDIYELAARYPSTIVKNNSLLAIKSLDKSSNR